MFSTVRRHFGRLGFFEAVRQTALQWFRLLCDRAMRPVYGQMGEELVLEHYLRYKPTGFYVEVGHNCPRRLSHTFNFYKAGWRGICIDANPSLTQDFKRVRPCDEVLNFAVTATEGNVHFKLGSDSALGRVVDGDRMASEPGVIVVPSRSLQSILDQHACPLAFELLSIDVEGRDFEVLRTLDLVKYRPEVICIEIHGLDLERQAENETCSYLRSLGYRLRSYVVMNAIFARFDQGAGTHGDAAASSIPTER